MSAAMDALEDRARRQLDRMRELNEQLAVIRVRETSPDGQITAEVDGLGTLLDLEFTHAISKLSPKDFETLLVATAGMAAQRAFARRAQLVESFNEEAADLIASSQLH
ncbi:YbaB/EbfC family nucleoid-associated protein [Antrihabitans sp. YC3-6]|uniref:YbaB/EbfC family nucleoid-associated protein n=2 Tax=Antrihabitans stalagmiti TaxID=2799499 RepID=A0A934NNQ0_9NOCA|nr:YbaB/EbfC family nucleoid-associated protein [Antrihabitans stalagmiti]